MTAAEPARPGTPRPIEEWTDEELVAEYRHLKGELAGQEPKDHDRDRVSPTLVDQEMKRRGLEPDREDLIPDVAGRPLEPDPSATSRGTAPDAGMESSG